TMRYFLSAADEHGVRQSKIKDLRQGMGGVSLPDRDFLHQYLTLTRCDLFFADKAILIEGTSERLLLPTMIAKTDSAAVGEPKLASQYVTVMEVGGAYAHRFHDLLSFLELRTLIVTDIDSVKPNEENKRKACPVAEGQFTSNGCLKDWFEPNISPTQLLAKTSVEKTKGARRLAYQVPDVADGPSGRSFEDAFILANLGLFDLGHGDAALLAYRHAADQKKSEFALKYAIEDTNWVVPRYIAEGLRWLAVGAPVVHVQVAVQGMAAVAEAAGQIIATEKGNGDA
ncbi:ATP-dependent endonuclease, partial [Xanthomonas hortorum]